MMPPRKRIVLDLSLRVYRRLEAMVEAEIVEGRGDAEKLGRRAGDVQAIWQSQRDGQRPSTRKAQHHLKSLFSPHACHGAPHEDKQPILKPLRTQGCPVFDAQ